MLRNSDLIVPGPHFIDRNAFQDIDVSLIGYKAVGLGKVSSLWTPPFIILTTNLHQRWEEFGENEIVTDQVLLTRSERKTFVDWLAKLANGQSLIVRSSGAGETIRERGLYKSRVCSTSLKEVIGAADEIWKAAGRVDSKRRVFAPVALLIQPHIKALALGHLSNERRVSQRSTYWICEEEGITRGHDSLIHSFSVEPERGDGWPKPLVTSRANFLSKLKQIAQATRHRRTRCHYEWLWDGARMWIVQADQEQEATTSKPGHFWDGKSPRLKIGDLKVLKKGPNKQVGKWPKIDCARVFKACKIPTPSLYVLENETHLENLSTGKCSKELGDDLTDLLKSPIVIRMDLLPSVDGPGYLLSRSDTLSTTHAAIKFMKNKARHARKQGLQSSEFCFIIHHFIPARSAALCYAQPGNTRVRIDSIWGIPDGLLYYPHDSYELDSIKRSAIQKRLRYKSDYIDVDEKGNWRPQKAGKPWDWKSSLETTEIRTIAQYSYKVVQKVNRPVQVMFFVGVDPTSGYPNCLPWFITKEFLPAEIKAAGQKGLGIGSFLISDESDIAKYRELLRGPGQRRIKIHLKPKAELLRSTEFLKKVAKIATASKCPIELEGSVLSHSFYLLQREGASVRCIDPFEPRFKKQEFGKLVRDYVPVIIQKHGERAKTYELTGGELLTLLKSKAVEEALELFWQHEDDLEFDELADLYEVMCSILRVKGKSERQLRTAATKKRNERGGFEKGILLLETQELPLVRIDQEKSGQLQAELQIPRSELAVQGTRVGKLDRKWRLKSNRRPRLKGNEIILSLVPPDSFESPISTVIKDKELEAEVLIKYSEKNVSLRLRKLEDYYDDPRQLKLFD